MPCAIKKEPLRENIDRHEPQPRVAGAIRFPEIMASHTLWEIGSEDQMALIFDNFNSVLVEFLPPSVGLTVYPLR
jgi:hypothetical protein